jgi:hypothetical protein
VTLGATAMVAWFTLIAAVGLMTWAGLGTPALVIGGAAAVLLIVFFSALQGVFVASLYRYATDGHTTSGFDADVLSQAFLPKR